MNKLGIEVGDVVTWGSKKNACEVKEVYSTFFYVNSSSSTISFTEPNLEIVTKVNSNVLKIEAKDLVTWGTKTDNYEVSQVFDTYFHIYGEDFSVSFNEPNLEIVKKSTKSLESKYGIELINKEMWCWDGDRIHEAFLIFVYAKQSGFKFPYITSYTVMQNASFEKPSKTYNPKFVFLDDDYTKEEMINIINELK